MSRNDNHGLWGCGLLLLVVAIALVIGLIKLSTGRIDTITVKDKERVCSTSKSCQYLIWTTQGDVYENTDAWLSLKFNSSDIYGQLQEGRTYRVKVNGWRNHLTSSYPNILSIESETTR